MDSILNLLKTFSTPSVKELKEASAELRLVQRYCEQDPSVNATSNIGSYARHTYARPLNDVDFFVVMKEKRRDVVHSAINRIMKRLRRDSPQKYRMRSQLNSYGLSIKGARFSLDLVPAIEVEVPTKSHPYYCILRRKKSERRNRGRGGRWHETDPIAASKDLIAANQRMNGMLRKIIRVLKFWNVQNKQGRSKKPLKSFYLEVMLYDFYSTLTWPNVIVAAFQHVASRIFDPVSAPSPHAECRTRLDTYLKYSVSATGSKALRKWTRQEVSDCLVASSRLIKEAFESQDVNLLKLAFKYE